MENYKSYKMFKFLLEKGAGRDININFLIIIFLSFLYTYNN